MPVLTLKDLTICYPSRRGDNIATHKVSLELEAGEILALVGESGTGKSTIARAIVDLIPAPGFIREGRIHFGEKDITAKKAHTMRGRSIGFIFQDPTTALNPVLNIGEQLTLVVKRHTKLKGKARQHKIHQLLSQVGIDNPSLRLKQYPHQLSGGLRQRVVIALALAGNPDLLIADEPTTALDVSLHAQILRLIQHLCKTQHMACLIITHDMGVVHKIADRVVVMHKGKIIDEGETKDIFLRPTHPYTKALIAAIPRTDIRQVRFATFDLTPPITLKNALKFASWFHTKDTTQTTSKPLVTCKRLGLQFLIQNSFFTNQRQYFWACKNINLDITRGETFGLVGESGSGKSSLARLLCGLYTPTIGEILFDDKPLNHHKSATLTTQMIFQNPYASLNPHMRIKDILAEPLLWYKLASPSEIPRIIDEVMSIVGLHTNAIQYYPYEFSGGQRQRLSIARALVTRPQFLICDEPTSSLDLSVQAQILNLLRDLQDELNLTLLFISHDLAVIRQICDHIAVMKDGKIIETAENDDLFTHPKTSYTQDFITKLPKYNAL